MNSPLITDNFNQIMENAFSADGNYSAAGIRKTCGLRPMKSLSMRFWGKGGKTLFNQEIAAYNKCVANVRAANAAAGLPPEAEPISQPTGGGNYQPSGNAPSLGDATMGMGAKIGIGAGIVVFLGLLTVVVFKVAKGKPVPVQVQA